jgi:hypothetical protein
MEKDIYFLKMDKNLLESFKMEKFLEKDNILLTNNVLVEVSGKMEN